MLVDCADILLEQFRNELLRQPDRLVLQPNLQMRLAILGLVEDQRGGIGFGLAHSEDYNSL